MFLAKMSINRPVMTTMTIMVFLIFGGLGYFTLNLNQMPEVEIPYITIQTIYPGAGPKEIETQITKRLEDVIATVSEIEMIQSFSLDGVSIVIMQFKLSKDVDVASQEVKDKIETVLADMPDDAEKPLVQKIDFGALPVVELVLSGDLDSKELFEIADKTLKDRFSQIQGVAQVKLTGGQEREIQVEMDDRVVFENSISLPQLLQILKIHNMDIPGGYFKIDDQEYTVRLDGVYSNLDEILELQVPTAYGPKKLKQFAKVYDSGKKVRERAVYFNNIKKFKDENIVRLGIIKSSEGNVVQVAKTVIEVLPEIEKILPEGCKLELVNDGSIFVQSAVNDTIWNILLGVIFTSIVLLIFLADIRSTFIIVLSMPTSIISTFMLMQMFDMTLNMMSLMGLSVSVGVLVANSVVVLENIFRHKNMGKNRKDAAYKGTSEVTVAVLASTLTNLVVFLPLANMSSMVGLFLKEFALAAAFATVFSLLFSFTLTPMLASLLLPQKDKSGIIKRTMDAFFKKWDDFYRWLLTFALSNKLVSSIIILLSFGLFILVIMLFGDKLGNEFVPIMDDGKIAVKVELPVGYNLDETSEVLTGIENRIKKYPEVKYMLTSLGKKTDMDIGTNMAIMNVELVDVKERERGLLEMISTFVKDLSDIPNAKILVEKAEEMGSGAAPVEFFLMGQKLEELERLKDSVIAHVKDVPGLINFENSSRAGKPEITVYPNRKMLAETGLSVMDIALTLRSSIEGIVSSKYRDKGNEYDILVTLGEESTNSPEKLGNIPIVSQMGTFRLSQVADIKFTKGFSKILHRDKFTAIQFTGSNAIGVPVGNVTDEIEKRIKKLEEDGVFPSGYMYQPGGNTKMMKEMQADMGFAFMLAILLTYMLLAAILESFFQPIFILLTLPLAMIGVITSLYYLDIALGITSMMAIIMLIGIVVNNAILMLDYSNQLRREEGMSARDALIQACPTKLKPIVMSTLAIVLGMLPMALGIGDAGVEMRVPMGVVSIAGLLVSTALTLFVVPAFYYVFSFSKKDGGGKKLQLK